MKKNIKKLERSDMKDIYIMQILKKFSFLTKLLSISIIQKVHFGYKMKSISFIQKNRGRKISALEPSIQMIRLLYFYMNII